MNPISDTQLSRISDQTRCGLIIEFMECLLLISTNSYSTFIVLHTLQIVKEYLKSSQPAISSLLTAW
jgi:hypothetical protein